MCVCVCVCTSMDWGPRSTKSPRNRKSAFGGRPVTSNNRIRSQNWPCKSPTTLMGACSRSNMGCRRNARLASTHSVRMRDSSQRRPAAPNRPSTISSSVQLFRDMSSIYLYYYNNALAFLGISAAAPQPIWVTRRQTAKF